MVMIHIQGDELRFSAGHFTIFSKTKREDLHGHNYEVRVRLECGAIENGLAFDYRDYRKICRELCGQLDRKMLLPQHSDYLRLEIGDDYIHAYFNEEKLPFLKRDVVILPLVNITIEELSYWFLQALVQDKATLSALGIQAIRVKVFNGPGQAGEARWRQALERGKQDVI